MPMQKQKFGKNSLVWKKISDYCKDKNKKKCLVAGLFLALLIVFGLIWAITIRQNPQPIVIEEPTLLEENLVLDPETTEADLLDEDATSTAVFGKNQTTSPTPTAKPTTTTPIAAPTPVPTATSTPPTRQPNPPILKISFPSENQTVELGSKQLCVVDEPQGGNTDGLQSRYSLDNGPFSSYENFTLLCLTLQDGSHTIKKQYRNKYGDESGVLSRTFNFKYVPEVSSTISGYMFSDLNCNATQDGGENKIGQSTSVSIFDSNYTTLASGQTNNGDYSFSGTFLQDEDSKNIRVSITAPSGYKSNPFFNSDQVTISKNNPNGSIIFPFVPNENVGSCNF